jgi:hypothetical protein
MTATAMSFAAPPRPSATPRRRPFLSGSVTEATTTQGTADSVVPDLIAQRLDVAESALDDLGIAYDEIGGGTFGVVDASAWVVCDQQPKPGGIADSLKLIVARPGDCGAAATGGGGGGGGLPNVTGKRLDVAESILDDRGIVYEEIGGGTFGIINRSAWVVCEQQPKPDTKTRRVKLIVDRPGEC